MCVEVCEYVFVVIGRRVCVARYVGLKVCGCVRMCLWGGVYEVCVDVFVGR